MTNTCSKRNNLDFLSSDQLGIMWGQQVGSQTLLSKCHLQMECNVHLAAVNERENFDIHINIVYLAPLSGRFVKLLVPHTWKPACIPFNLKTNPREYLETCSDGSLSFFHNHPHYVPKISLQFLLDLSSKLNQSPLQCLPTGQA